LPAAARVLGVLTALLFVVTSLRIFAGELLLPTSSPMPFFVYPVFVATLGSWIWTLLTDRITATESADAV
jgi:hypothetical protein